MHTARVRAPAARPAFNPEIASSTTRPAVMGIFRIQPCHDEDWYVQFDGSTEHNVAPAKYGAGCGFPCKTSFAVMIPKLGRGTPDFSRARGAYLLEANYYANR